MIVDAHQHFWQISRGVNTWIDDSISGIRRDYSPEHLAPYLKHLGIDKTILVQASETVEENRFMTDLADQCDFIGGIVAWVDLSASSAVDKLEQLAANPLIKGIRPVLQGIEDDEWILQENVISALRELPILGLRFDALIQTRHLNAISEVASLIPELAIVVDHAAKPVISDGAEPDAAWFDGMSELAQNEQVFCKLSGLVTEHGEGWTVNALRPVFEHLLNVFTPDRLMWGSDWPVLELDGSYVQWFSCVNSLISDLSSTERDQILGGSAARFYGLENK